MIDDGSWLQVPRFLPLMLEIIFTIDYEIYGNGTGTLKELVLDSTARLAEIFQRHGANFVVFAEALEFLKMEEYRADPDVAGVRTQLRQLREQGYEIALHLHPQWANARHSNGAWVLDYAEYNLCTLSPERIGQIVDNAIAWLRDVLGDPAFAPLSFRAGNWLFQPTRDAARVLAARGVKVDSSVFKGGLQRQHRLDYRPALSNGWHWKFADDVNVPDVNGALLELPIYTRMVPFWRMLTGKRLRIQRKVPSGVRGTPFSRRWADFLRWRYPRKLDFCRMTLSELTRMVDTVRREDRHTPAVVKPLVAIGHSKDLVDFGTIATFLEWLRERSIPVTTLARLAGELEPRLGTAPCSAGRESATQSIPAAASC